MMRSLLFVPGDSLHKFAKALGFSKADALILDLEDSVAPAGKAEARGTVATMLASERQGKKLFVRVNAQDTGLILDDLAAVMPLAPDGIVLPKCRHADDVTLLGQYLAAFEAAFGLPSGGTGILPIVTETGESVLGLGSYGPDPRLRGLMWGAEDLAASINATDNRQGSDRDYAAPFLLARNLSLMAASRAGVPAIDTVFTMISDLDHLRREARIARRDGFSAKAVIHPSHVDPVNSVFQPTEAEILWAQRVVEAFEQSPGFGVVQIDGRMIDKPHERTARNILAALA